MVRVKSPVAPKAFRVASTSESFAGCGGILHPQTLLAAEIISSHNIQPLTINPPCNNHVSSEYSLSSLNSGQQAKNDIDTNNAVVDNSTLASSISSSSSMSAHPSNNKSHKPFSLLVLLNSHKCTVSDGGKPDKHDVGQSVAVDLSHLKKHRKIDSLHGLHQCPICLKKFDFKSHLLRHSRIHSGEKPYACKVCHKSFPRSYDLTVHLRVHSGEKPYQCDVCSKSFPISSGLVTHKRVHSGEKPYQCNLCSKSFKQKQHLLDHERIHSGEKPYQCNVCPKSFISSSYLSKHKYHVHKIIPSFKAV